jgi:hypothetical protein
MNTNLNKLIVLVFIIVTSTCNNKYKNLEYIIDSYLDKDVSNQLLKVVIIPKNTGCYTCKKEYIDSLSYLCDKYNFIITNYKVYKERCLNIIYDSLDLIDKTDYGYSETILVELKNGSVNNVMVLKSNNTQ